MKFLIGEKVKYKMNYNGIVDDYDAVVVDNVGCIRLFVYLPDGVKHDTTLIKEQLEYIQKEKKMKIDTKSPDFKPDFGYKQSKTKKECPNPEFHNKNVHRIAIMKKDHYGSKGDKDERGLPGWTAFGVCMGCGKKFTVYAFYPDGECDK